MNLHAIQWKERSDELKRLLEPDAQVNIVALPSGLEADIYKMTTDGESYVLKVWNRESRPNIALQYAILSRLHRQGISVSRPYGWGYDEHQHQVLLTSYDGLPIREVTEDKLTVLARILTDIYQAGAAMIEERLIPKYDFTSYFFDSVGQYEDLQSVPQQLLPLARVSHSHLIHGDFHLLNVLEQNGQYAVIDWTNVQAGDARYDIAWSVTLIRIHLSEQYARHYLAEIRKRFPIPEAEYEIFEAIACLRFLFLQRTNHQNLNDHARDALLNLLRSNRYLGEHLLK